MVKFKVDPIESEVDEQNSDRYCMVHYIIVIQLYTITKPLPIALIKYSPVDRANNAFPGDCSNEEM